MPNGGGEHTVVLTAGCSKALVKVSLLGQCLKLGSGRGFQGVVYLDVCKYILFEMEIMPF